MLIFRILSTGHQDTCSSCHLYLYLHQAREARKYMRKIFVCCHKRDFGTKFINSVVAARFSQTPRPVPPLTCYYSGGNGLEQGAPVHSNLSRVVRLVNVVVFSVSHHVQAFAEFHAGCRSQSNWWRYERAATRHGCCENGKAKHGAEHCAVRLLLARVVSWCPNWGARRCTVRRGVQAPCEPPSGSGGIPHIRTSFRAPPMA